MVTCQKILVGALKTQRNCSPAPKCIPHLFIGGSYLLEKYKGSLSQFRVNEYSLSNKYKRVMAISQPEGCSHSTVRPGKQATDLTLRC